MIHRQMHRQVGGFGEQMDRQKDAGTEIQLGGQPHIYMEQNTNILQTETVYKAVFVLKDGMAGG